MMEPSKTKYEKYNGEVDKEEINLRTKRGKECDNWWKRVRIEW